MTMNTKQIIAWGLEVPSYKSKTKTKPKRNGILRLIERSPIQCRRCRVCQEALGENPDCSYCEHKRDELGWGV